MRMNQESRGHGRRAAGALLAVICLLFSFLSMGFAESFEKDTLGTLVNVDRSWEISCLPIADYSVHPELIREDTIIIDLEPTEASQPRMNLALVVSEKWPQVEQLSGLSPADLQAIQDAYLIENDAPTFEIIETSSGIGLFIVRPGAETDAFLFTIQHGIEIELHLMSGAAEAKLSSDDLQRAIDFLDGISVVTK